MTGIELTTAVKVMAGPVTALAKASKNVVNREITKYKNEQLVKKLTQKIAAVEKVKTFWQRDKEVSLSTFYYPSKVLFEERRPVSVASLKAFLPEHNYVIEGTVGQGKSIFLRYLCVQELKETGTGRIPVFVELRNVDENGLMPSIYRAIENLGLSIDDALFEFYAESRQLVILLDAFDELGGEYVKGVIRDLDTLSERYPELQLFITSRPDSHIQGSRHFRVVKLAPLRPSDHPLFFKKIAVVKNDVDKLVKAIQGSSAEVANLLTTPLMLTLFVIVYQAETTIPDELPDFFDALFQTLFTKHDKSKPGLARVHQSGLGERRLQQLFQGFCFASLQMKNGNSLTLDAFNKAFDQAVKITGISTEVEPFKYDIVKVSCLMVEEGYLLHFIHKSVLEFFAASFIRDLHEAHVDKFFKQLLNKVYFMHYWVQVLRFLADLDPYKYAKFYAIPYLKKEMKAYGIAGPDYLVGDERRLARRVLKDFGMVYELRDSVRGDIDGGFEYVATRFEHVPTSYIIDGLNEIMTHVFGGFEHDAFSLREMRERIPSVVTGEQYSKRIEVKWLEIASEEEFNHLVPIIAAAFDDATRQLRNFKQFIHEEGEKQALFEL